MSTSGFAALMRRPTSVIDRVRLSWFAGLTSFQPRTMSGAWLEANTPTSLAMAGPRGVLGAGVAHLGEEFALGHAGDDEIEAQEIGVHARREKNDVVALHRLAHLGFQGIAVQDLFPVGAVFRAEGRGALEIEEKLAQPIVSHGSILPRPASWGRSAPPGFAGWSRCRRAPSAPAANAAPRPLHRPGSPSCRRARAGRSGAAAPPSAPR